MSLLVFAISLTGFSILAGLLGALTGLGGGIIVIPVIVLVFHLPIHYAMGASLISVIATSSSAGVSYLRQGYPNLRIGMLLEVTAVTGAIIGAGLVTVFPKKILMILFSALLFFSAYLTLKRREESERYNKSHPWATFFKLDNLHPAQLDVAPYYVQQVPQALFLLAIAGLLSGLLGIGSGTMKVLAMDHSLKLPYKVATSTSNFMIGLTAAASAGIYFLQGYIQPVIVFPVLIGVTIGAFFGTKLMSHLHTYYLRIIFSIAICFISAQMFYNAVTN